jgi:hypothetical protein
MSVEEICRVERICCNFPEFDPRLRKILLREIKRRGEFSQTIDYLTQSLKLVLLFLQGIVSRFHQSATNDQEKIITEIELTDLSNQSQSGISS